MKGFSTLSSAPKLEPHHPMQFDIILTDTLFGSYPSAQDSQCILSQQCSVAVSVTNLKNIFESL